MYALQMPPDPIHYPCTDGEPMAQNTEQYEWLVFFRDNLNVLLKDALVAGDLFWYPVEGNNKIRLAPDVLVALGRPKGPRSSYMQWEEDGQPPQVVFEIWSPGNTLKEMVDKLRFYNQYGVSEFYTYDPDNNYFAAYIRQNGGDLEPVPVGGEWISPRMKVRFVRGPERLEVYHPDGTPFRSFSDIKAEADALKTAVEAEQARAEAATQALSVERERAEAERARAEAATQALLAERARAEELAAKLKALGML